MIPFPGGASGKQPACQCRRCETRFHPWVEKTPAGRHCNPLQYSCLENPMDRGAWQTIVHRVTQSRTWLKRLSTHLSNWFFLNNQVSTFPNSNEYRLLPYIICAIRYYIFWLQKLAVKILPLFTAKTSASNTGPGTHFVLLLLNESIIF